jgi:glyoxylase-like metal-dependent hydrolase (beta-lactamase superfamily II)
MSASRPVNGIWASPAEDLSGAPVIPGVWVSALPFPNPLKYVFSYLIETATGLVVVDLGWNTDEGWQTFLSGLSHAGKSLDDVSGVVITHVHPDHYGLASRLRDNSSAWIAVHPAERPQLALDDAEAERRIEDMVRWLRQCGAPEMEIEQLRAESVTIAAEFSKIQPEADLVDGQPVAGTDGSLLAVHTPGHTPGHVCFLDRERKIIFTGDHVLPRVTPNVSKRPTSDEDPLQDFTRSLRHVDSLDRGGPLLALPGHEWAFDGLHERLAEIEGHHTARLDEMEAAVRQGGSTVWEVAQAVRWSRPFGTLEGRARRSAIGETYSHLYRLHMRGRLSMVLGWPDRWTIASASRW